MIGKPLHRAVSSRLEPMDDLLTMSGGVGGRNAAEGETQLTGERFDAVRFHLIIVTCRQAETALEHCSVVT